MPFRRRDVVDHDVRIGQQAMKERLAFGRFKVGGHAAFVGIEIGEEPAAVDVDAVVGERSTTTRDVTVRWLDLDDVGSDVGQHLGRVGR